MREVYGFCGEYLTALYLGNRLHGERQSAVLEKLSRYTGLSAEYLEQCALRPEASEYTSVRLAPDQKSLASYDARFTLPYTKRAGRQDPVGDDGSMGRLMPAFHGAFMKYAGMACPSKRPVVSQLTWVMYPMLQWNMDRC